MPLPLVLNTNEIKNSAGTEVEFTRKSTQGSTVEYAQTNEAPNREHRLRLANQTLGTGEDERRRSNLRITKEVTGVSGKVRTVSWSLTMDIPTGDISDYTEPKNLMAEGLSFCATTGAATAVLFDCTGYGADAIVNGNSA